ncbi:PD-(D/E)XK nuclease family protein [Campylobacter lari]|uniref:PDDEXK-like family protein n=1 Tax=Campylobacter lari TaxID=201 RepID=UPI001F09512A|nr:PD-(D/E)XK nuclease family protein [Campylobacter lari]MCH3697110.1 PD-(D/E)XK nuclease family protein [Campylobacter lari]MCH3700419.1 PD-(D/E)XK nuclease family protein [Campylobacter lari]MCV3334395.1 PD-(D/E)XK nuclease family protein [Campylobacter lari]MCV3350082.1 PD-(D/E)XK nuclease family protein [Campylobacter lari]
MKNFIEELLRVNNKFEENTKKGMSDINIFEALGVEYKENYHSKFIAYLIDPHGDHYQEFFANKFLKKLERYTKAKKFKNLTAHDIEIVETEACVKDNRRIDILISLKDKRYIIIENKLYAKDQPNQLKDYVKHIKEKVKNIDDFHENILTIYLHKNEDTEPSKYSLGTKNGFKINDDLIYDSNDKKMSFYLKMDYKWIKEWINACIGVCENKVKNNEIDKKFKNDMQNVIFTLNQYKNILEWYVTDEYVARDYVLNFLKENKENLKNTMALYRCTKNKRDFKDVDYDKYKKAKEIVREKWDEICEELLNDFFNGLEKEFEKERTICDEKWFGYKLDEKRVNYDWFDFYPKIYEDDNDVWPSVGVYFGKSDYDNFGLTFKINCNEEDEKYKEFFQNSNIRNDNIRRSGEHYYYDEFENFNFKEKYAFVYWLINNHGNWMVEFSKILEEFLNKETIKSALENINNELKPNK